LINHSRFRKNCIIVFAFATLKDCVKHTYFGIVKLCLLIQILSSLAFVHLLVERKKRKRKKGKEAKGKKDENPIILISATMTQRCLTRVRSIATISERVVIFHHRPLFQISGVIRTIIHISHIACSRRNCFVHLQTIVKG